MNYESFDVLLYVEGSNDFDARMERLHAVCAGLDAHNLTDHVLALIDDGNKLYVLWNNKHYEQHAPKMQSVWHLYGGEASKIVSCLYHDGMAFGDGTASVSHNGPLVVSVGPVAHIVDQLARLRVGAYSRDERAL